MPNRILKESIRESDSIDALSWFEEVLFYRLIVSCDDYGRFDGRISVIKNRLFPLKDDLTLKTVSRAIEKLATVGLVALYEFEGKPYLYLPTWTAHQNVRAKRSKYPEPVTVCEAVKASASICNQTHAEESTGTHPQENVPVIQSVSESKTESESVSQSEPLAEGHTPTVDEVARYCQGKALAVDAQRFVDYYQARGWQVNNTPVRDWQALARLWHRSPTGPPKRVTQQNYTQRTYHFDDAAFMDKFMAGYEED